MLIAIDFDDTLTADPVMFRTLIAVTQSFGHRVICVTARRDTEENRECLSDWMKEHGIDLYTHFTSLASKVDHMQRIGVKVDIWIDDDPRKCALGH
jgi:pyridoxine 5'-phosphate synthase PdxJ